MKKSKVIRTPEFMTPSGRAYQLLYYEDEKLVKSKVVYLNRNDETRRLDREQ